MRTIIAVAVQFVICAAPALAQNLGAVPSPDIVAGERSVEYRAAYGMNDGSAADAFAHRLHFQQSLSGAWRVRLIVQQGRRGGDPLRTQTAALQIFTQFAESENTGGWDSGLRFDGIVPLENDRPARARAGWLNSLELGKRWQLRSNIFLSREFGDLAAEGFGVETREEATFKVNETLRVGAQIFNNFNTTAHLGSYNEQRHQIGPIVRWNVTKNVKIDASALFGASRAATDADFRVFATYGF